MTKALSHEECARRIVQRELGRPVSIHDDGSRPSMYDLRVGSVGRPEIAIECVGAVDAQRTETWNLGPGRGSLTLPIAGDWHVILRPGAPVKRIREALLRVLCACIEAGVEGYVRVDAFLRIKSPILFARLRGLRIASVGRYNPGSGKVHLGMTGFGGAVDPTGSDVPRWISEFLRAQKHKDVLRKLRESGAGEAHVFVQVSFGGVPWLVESYLGTATELLPPTSPDLPAPVDSVWIMYGVKGLRYDGAAWRFFSAVVPAMA